MRRRGKLQAELKANEAKKASYKRLVDGKLLTQRQYDAKIAELDAEADRKKAELEKKQFERNRKVQIAQALMNAAVGSIKVWDDPGFPLAIALQALIAAQLAAQIAVINSQKPQFGGGGLLYGPAHSDKSKGMPVMHPYTGQVQAYLEGGEGVTKKFAMQSKQLYTVTGTPSQITSTLNSIYGGMSWDSPATVTRTIKPFWQTRTYQLINYPAIQSVFVQKRFYESGGVFNRQTKRDDQTTHTIVVKDEETKAIMLAVLDRLNDPVAPLSTTSFH